MPSENIFVVIDNEWINNEGDNLGKDLHSPTSNKKKKKKKKNGTEEIHSCNDDSTHYKKVKIPNSIKNIVKQAHLWGW